jgi:hypothetical protein
MTKADERAIELERFNRMAHNSDAYPTPAQSTAAVSPFHDHA